MAAEKIGRAKCPLCRGNRARLSLSKNGLACLTCDGCNLQTFARSGTSDELLRALHIPDAAPAPEPAAPAPAAPAPALPAPAAPPRPPVDMAERATWGLGAW